MEEGTERKVVNYISGHLDLTLAEFEAHYRATIDAALGRGEGFVIGDARGTDAIAQNYLLGKTTAVVVYHMFTSPRNNSGFPTVGGFESDEGRDTRMTADSDQDIAWVRPGRQSLAPKESGSSQAAKASRTALMANRLELKRSPGDGLIGSSARTSWHRRPTHALHRSITGLHRDGSFVGISSRRRDHEWSQPRRCQTALRGRPTITLVTTDCHRLR